MKGFFITGSDTDVGKTYFSCQLISHLQQSANVIPRKPVESGCELKNKKLYPADADKLIKACQQPHSLNDVCPYRFAPAISPQLAAANADVILTLDNLLSACTAGLEETDTLLVEGAGGFLSPIGTNILNADLAKALRLPVILVVNNKLGSVNQTLLSINAIENYQLKLQAIVLNSTQKNSLNPLITNAKEIAQFSHYPIIELGHKKKMSQEQFKQLLLTP